MDEVHFITGCAPSPFTAQVVYIYGASSKTANDWQRQLTLAAPSDFSSGDDFGAWLALVNVRRFAHNVVVCRVPYALLLGTSVAIFGSLAAVSAPSAVNEVTYPGVKGFVFIYERTGAGWTNANPALVIPNPSLNGGRFGGSISLSGSEILVACSGPRSDLNNTMRGAVYLFDHTGALKATYTPPNNDREFVYPAVALGEEVLAFTVHAWNYSSVVMIDRASGMSFVHESATLAFGRALAVHGASVLVGSRRSAYLYTFSNVTLEFELEQSFIPSDNNTAPSFGASVAITTNRLLIGAPTGEGRSSVCRSPMLSYYYFTFYSLHFFPQSTGTATVYYKENDTWDTGILLGATDGMSGDQYGYSVAITSRQLLIGSFGTVCPMCIAFVPGAVYVRVLPPSIRPFLFVCFSLSFI